MVNFALARSLLSYEIVIWDRMNKTGLHKLEVVVNTLIKLILNRDRFYSTIQLYNDFCVLNINEL